HRCDARGRVRRRCGTRAPACRPTLSAALRTRAAARASTESALRLLRGASGAQTAQRRRAGLHRLAEGRGARRAHATAPDAGRLPGPPRRLIPRATGQGTALSVWTTTG